jgi:hypothetical protein
LTITVGRAVFIGSGCAFTGHAAIDIADEVMIAHKVNLITAGHPVEPDKRRAYVTAQPITINTNVWVGAAATIPARCEHRSSRGGCRRRGRHTRRASCNAGSGRAGKGYPAPVGTPLRGSGSMNA